MTKIDINKKYQTILADPPWNEQGGGKIKRGADKHYSLMPTKDITAMKDRVEQFMHDDAHIYLWVTNNFLIDGLKGFTVQSFILPGGTTSVCPA